MSATPVLLRSVTATTGLRRELVGFIVFTVLQWSVWVAVILYAFGQGGAVLAAIASVAQLVPAAVLSPSLARIEDRVPRGRALVLLYLGVAAGCAITLGALLLQLAPAVVIGTAVLLMVVTSAVRPVHFGVLPELSSAPEELVSANALSAAGDGFAEFLGPAIAGLLVAASGSWVVLLIATVLALLSALLCVGLRTGPLEGTPRQAGREAQSEHGGLRAIRGDYAALGLLLVLALDHVFAGALDVLGVSFSDHVLELGERGAGFVIGSLGIGGFVGAFIGGSFSRRPRLATVITLGAALSGLAFAAVALLGSLAPTMFALAVVGAGGALALVAGRTLLQRTTDDHLLTRVFAVQESSSLLAMGAGAVLAPVVLGWLNPRTAFVPFGIGVLALAASAWLLVRRLDGRARLYVDEVELLRGVPFLGVLPQYDLERLAARATWRDVEPGQVVVRQGDIGTEFAGGRQQGEREGVGREDREAALALNPLDGSAEIADFAEGVRVLEDRPEKVAFGQRVAGDDGPAEGFSAGFEHGQRLGDRKSVV